ncbi:uncharacterized protein METZ01_LOCUS173431, partial [marine metagenome]
LRGFASVAARGRSRAHRRNRTLAWRTQRDVRRRVRHTHQRRCLQLRLDAVPRLLRRQNRRLDERPLHATAQDALQSRPRPSAVRFLRSRRRARPARLLLNLATTRQQLRRSRREKSHPQGTRRVQAAWPSERTATPHTRLRTRLPRRDPPRSLPLHRPSPFASCNPV